MYLAFKGNMLWCTVIKFFDRTPNLLILLYCTVCVWSNFLLLSLIKPESVIPKIRLSDACYYCSTIKVPLNFLFLQLTAVQIDLVMDKSICHRPIDGVVCLWNILLFPVSCHYLLPKAIQSIHPVRLSVPWHYASS